MDSNVNKILQNIVNTATLAADEAKAAVHSAGKAVAGKYDEVKMNIELARLSDEQEDVFSDIGRMLFLMHTGAVKDTVMSDEGEKSPQQVIDALLVSAEQVQQEVRQQVCYDVLVQRMDQELLDELVGLIVETLYDKAQTIRIGSHDYPAALVQERMRQIDSFCLEYVCACLRKSNPSIRNIKQYLLMALFNAPVTMSHYYYNKAQNALNDWYTGGIANEN